ncbi:Lysophospholipase L1 or related esterase. Includes spore coat protein LipC/YcsK (TesA) [Eupransor demetentiae]|uniref:Lysophospholipase L1 or related esterase. Includes spore coat protein LipC/YcsK (TesA) n=2 Tax=Eupransor demetentiae TaxID=3109584 RepID=A0ABM9N6S0_9LACO|nr:Lysophospholipase L1 or related esterase. Includes spore coat protein LipC/YcsK (TesA) [Lactobacillaceae bacterium LMG 33000]
MVLLYHFYPKIFTGGFVGVDLFFAFSGFLITGLVIDEYSRDDHFRLFNFYVRRFKRIVPPLLLAVVIVLPMSLLISRDFITDISHQVAAVLGFVTNYFEILTGGDYENQFMPHLFVHTWTLAIEMHFYLIWGLILWFLVRNVIKQRHFSVVARGEMLRERVGLAAIIIVMIQLVLVNVEVLQGTNVNQLYFADLTHSFPFFLGALVASFTGVYHLPEAFQRLIDRWSTRRAIVLMFLGFAVLMTLLFCLHYDNDVTYLYGFLLASLATSVMIIAARVLHEKTPNIKEPAILTFLADASYSVYLYHWPLLIIFSHLMERNEAIILTTVLSFVLAALSYYWVEPLLTNRKLGFQHNRKPWLVGRWTAYCCLALLTVNGAWICTQAPQMSSLTRKLWVGNVQQDLDQLNGLAGQFNQNTSSASPVQKGKIPAGVTIIGDSVTLGTRASLAERVKNASIDAQANRNMGEANAIVAQQIKANTLRKNVVICIGTNSLDDYEQQLQDLIDQIPKGHRLILMTPYDGQADATWNSAKLAVLERKLPAKYNYITIADWNKIAPAHKEIFGGGDGTHFAGNSEGDELYAKAINQALKEAAKKPVKS